MPAHTPGYYKPTFAYLYFVGVTARAGTDLNYSKSQNAHKKRFKIVAPEGNSTATARRNW